MRVNVIKLAIVDDNTLFRKTLTDYLSQQSFLEVIIEVSDVFELLNRLESDTADILVTDIVMPNTSDIEALKIIRNKFPDLKVVVLSMSTNLILINQLMEIGIHAYISKTDEPAHLMQAIVAASEDKIYRNRLLTEALYLDKQINRKKNGESINVILDDREKKIVQLLWQEKSNKDIAKEIFLSVRSIEKIRQVIKQKLGVKSMIGMLKYALMNNIIETSEVHEQNIVF
ncbi:MAG: response regulator transcription factor [Chitinophagaceae bacterium]